MRLRLLPFFLFVQAASAQVAVFPSLENFDGVVPPNFPVGWSASGFSISTSTPFSSPNCVLATGNTMIKQLTSKVFIFTDKIPDKLMYYERRSNTAAGYRMEVKASIDGINFNILLARFDTIPTTANYVQRIVPLYDAGLKQQSNVRIRWQLLGDNTNTTGVLRIDDVTLTVTTGFDIGISKMTVAPVAPTRKDSISLLTVIKNYGALPSSNVTIHFFCDCTSQGASKMKEEFSALHGLLLAPGDSLSCMVIHAPMKADEYRFMSVIEYPPDENHTNDTARTVVNVGNLKGDIQINEIMYYPVGDEPEWVELFNVSSDTVNIKNWKISDSNSSTKSIIAQLDAFIPPDSFLVVAKDIIFTSNHPGVPVIITNFSALNNSSSDAVVLYDARSISIDSVTYAPSWGGQNGKSLERIDLEMPSTASSNWGTSQDSIGSTPGMKNSIARLDYDLILGPLTQTQIMIGGKMIPSVNIRVQNVGKRTADSVCVSFYSDINHNSIPEPTEYISHKVSSQPLAARDSILFSESFPQLVSGATTIIVLIDWWRDERVRNNQASFSVKTSCDPLAVVINEIMFDPLNDQNEWIEFFNRSNQPIDLSHWTFNDRPTVNSSNSFEIPGQSSAMKPGDFMIAEADSSFFKIFQYLSQTDSTVHICILNHSSGFSLNNDGDAVVLKDLTGQTIDSVAYLASWHHPDVVDTKGRSLERINPNIESNDPRNWSTCTNILGGTPGKVNSIMTSSSSNNSSISISPNPFSPDGDGFEDFCIIRYSLPLMTSTINVKIYDIKGRLVRTLANGELAGRQGELVWNGFDDNKQRARIGVYVIFLEATDRSSGKVVTAKTVAVVATKL